MRAKALLAAAAAAALGGCELFGPVLDRSMERAPYRACHSFPAAIEAGDAPAQCLRLVLERSEGDPEALREGRLRAGDRLLGLLGGGPDCGGFFTHFTATGDTPGPGRMRLAAYDVAARGMVPRDFRWSRGAASRRWTVDNVGSPLLNPASFSVEVEEGEVRLHRLCFAGYGR